MSSRSATRSASAIARSVSTASSGIVACCATSASSSIACGRVARRHADRPPEALRHPLRPVTLPPSSSASSAICERRAARGSLERRAHEQRRESGVLRRLVARAAERVDARVHQRARLSPHEHGNARRGAEDVHARLLALGAQRRCTIAGAITGDGTIGGSTTRRRRVVEQRAHRRRVARRPRVAASRDGRPPRRLIGVEEAARQRLDLVRRHVERAAQVVVAASSSRRALPTRRGSSPALPCPRAGAASAPRTCASRAASSASLTPFSRTSRTCAQIARAASAARSAGASACTTNTPSDVGV